MDSYEEKNTHTPDTHRTICKKRRQGDAYNNQ